MRRPSTPTLDAIGARRRVATRPSPTPDALDRGRRRRVTPRHHASVRRQVIRSSTRASIALTRARVDVDRRALRARARFATSTRDTQKHRSIDRSIARDREWTIASGF